MQVLCRIFGANESRAPSLHCPYTSQKSGQCTWSKSKITSRHACKTKKVAVRTDTTGSRSTEGDHQSLAPASKRPTARKAVCKASSHWSLSSSLARSSDGRKRRSAFALCTADAETRATPASSSQDLPFLPLPLPFIRPVCSLCPFQIKRQEKVLKEVHLRSA